MPAAVEKDPGLLILDFDGTFTDVDEEAAPFLEGYRAGLAELAGRPIDDAWERALGTVQRDPDAHGFAYEDKIVAPSHADPYILATSVARLVIEELDDPSLHEGLEGLFRRCYAQSATAFRPDAGEVLDAVLATGRPVWVVSNSHTENVVAKLEQLRPAALREITVVGDARKFHLVEPEPSDPRFDAVPPEIDVEGLGRPLYLRRGLYYERLREIWTETGIGPERTMVCGDIFELDLALPATLGARVHLVGRDRTPSWERELAARMGGSFSTELRGLLAALT